jgi:hypothetical protein
MDAFWNICFAFLVAIAWFRARWQNKGEQQRERTTKGLRWNSESGNQETRKKFQ